LVPAVGVKAGKANSVNLRAEIGSKFNGACCCI